MPNIPDFGLPPEPLAAASKPDKGSAVSRETLEKLGRSDAAVMPDSPLGQQAASAREQLADLTSRTLSRPRETRIFTISNQKGGVGKTSTAVNLAAALAHRGMNVLVIDNDPQGNASTALGIDHGVDVPSTYDVLINDTPLADIIQPCPDVDNLWCAPATIDLAGAEIELVSMMARESRLSTAISDYAAAREAAGQPRLDYIFIDCPPSLGLLTINAFCAAREVLIPIQCEYYALEGLSQLLKNISMIQKHLNPQLAISTILLTMYDGRTNLSSQVADEVREHFPHQVLTTPIPRSVRISEAPSYQQTVISYDPASPGAIAYLKAAVEIAEKV
ncbi:ParA family protein [Rothia nasimurium]|uniref:ParA family protein n=1 Tax=Rothia nasimurium TaxID=85336 RepID=UPI003B9EC82A